VAAHAIATNHPTVARPASASHSNGQNAARIRALVEGVGLGSFNLVFTEFETTRCPCLFLSDY
jgi:hypothetical protein